MKGRRCVRGVPLTHNCPEHMQHVRRGIERTAEKAAITRFGHSVQKSTRERGRRASMSGRFLMYLPSPIVSTKRSRDECMLSSFISRTNQHKSRTLQARPRRKFPRGRMSPEKNLRVGFIKLVMIAVMLERPTKATHIIVMQI